MHLVVKELPFIIISILFIIAGYIIKDIPNGGLSDKLYVLGAYFLCVTLCIILFVYNPRYIIYVPLGLGVLLAVVYIIIPNKNI